MKRDKPQATITDQGRAFIEKARELGCDEDPARFEEALRQIAKAKPQPAGPRGEQRGRGKRGPAGER